MTGYNNGRTAKEVAEIITEMRHGEIEHKETRTEREKAEANNRARKRIEEMELEKAGSDDYELKGVNLTEPTSITPEQSKQRTAAAKASAFGKFLI